MKNKQPDNSYLLPSTIFFGQYLVVRGIIEPGQLDQALCLQKERNKLLGRLAVEKGCLTEEQALEIKSAQKNIDLPFGVIAVDKGLLSRDQLDDLLFSQVVNTTHVGEALVELGHLDPEKLGSLLNSYYQDESSRLEKIESALREVASSALIRAGIHALDRTFIRFAHEPINISSVGGIPEVLDHDLCFLIRIDMQPGKSLCMRARLSDASAIRIAGRKGLKDAEKKCGPRCLGRNLMFFTIVKRYLAAQLKYQGYPVSGARMVRSKEIKEDCSRDCVMVILTSSAGEFQIEFS